MNILIDAKFLYEQDCGIKTFLYNILKELLKISDEINCSGAGCNNRDYSPKNTNININTNNADNNYADNNYLDIARINFINIYIMGLSGKISKLTHEDLKLERIDKKQNLFISMKRFASSNPVLYNSIKKIYRLRKKQINKIHYTRYGDTANDTANNAIGNKTAHNADDTDILHFDIFWTPYQTEIDSAIAKKKFITIHDLYPLTNGENTNGRNTIEKPKSAAFKNYMDKYLEVFDGITTCSEFVTKDVNRFYSRLLERKNKIGIYSVKCAYDKNVFKKISNGEILKHFKDKYALDNPFILYVGSLHPRKNVLNLLKAFKVLKNGLKTDRNSSEISCIKLIDNLELVIISNTAAPDKETSALLDELKKYVKILKHIDNEKLALFYNTAEVFVFPSFYEGFGIPPLEAFACGTPVIASDITAIPEVCGNAAYYVNPFSIDDIKNAIYKVITSADTKKDLVKKGTERAENFSWRRSAIDLLKAFSAELEK